MICSKNPACWLHVKQQARGGSQINTLNFSEPPATPAGMFVEVYDYITHMVNHPASFDVSTVFESTGIQV